MRRSSAELKTLARESLIGNYGIFIGSLLLTTLFSSIMGYFSLWMFPEPNNTVMMITGLLFDFLIAMLMQVLTAGLLRISLCVSRHEPVQFKDLFFGFTHHPDRFLVVALIFGLLSRLLITLPSWLFNKYGMSSMPSYQQMIKSTITQDSMTAIFTFAFSFLAIMCLILLAGSLVYSLILLPFAMTIFLLVDYNDYSAFEALKESVRMMRGNKWRYFYLNYLSFFGLYCIGILSFGIALLWIQPYVNVTVANLYRELRKEI